LTASTGSSVTKLASRRQGENRRETEDGKGMCVCVCVREVNFSEALYRIAVAMASQAHIDVV
jgi:hypothetical protein